MQQLVTTVTTCALCGVRDFALRQRFGDLKDRESTRGGGFSQRSSGTFIPSCFILR